MAELIPNHGIYCPKCHVLLMKASAFYGEIKCHKCKEVVSLKFLTDIFWGKVLTPSVKTNTIQTENS